MLDGGQMNIDERLEKLAERTRRHRSERRIAGLYADRDGTPHGAACGSQYPTRRRNGAGRQHLSESRPTH
jgi:hypothetical protein